MARLSILGALALLVLSLACGSSDPAPDGSVEQGADPADGSPPANDAAVPIGDGNVLPWDLAPKADLTNVSCTPGDPLMCDEDKTVQCVGGKCVPCPTSYVDCDRKDDCECVGACDGDKCAVDPVKPPKPPKN